MNEVIFLFVLALIWIVLAVVQDLKKREVPNWINFSLIIFALGFRFFYSLFSQQNFNFFYQGLIGLGIFFLFGNLLYYGKMFAGGDAKLMIALGAVLPFSEDLFLNIKIFVLFFAIFLFIGACYGFVWTLFLSLKNFKAFKKDFSNRLKANKKLIYPLMIIGLSLVIFGINRASLFFLGILIFFLPYFYLYAKSVDESCMVKRIKTDKLTEGDWNYKNLKIGKKIIKADWDGLSEQDIKLVKKKYKEIIIRQGIPFTPVFLISFLVLVLLWIMEVIESFFFWF